MFFGPQVSLLFPFWPLRGNNSHFLPGPQSDDRWGLCTVDPLAVFVWNPPLWDAVLQSRASLTLSAAGRCEGCVILTFVLSLAQPENEPLERLLAGPEELILLHRGVLVISGLGEADAPVGCPWTPVSKDLLGRLLDVEVFVEEAGGGLGTVWHRGEGGRGLRTVLGGCGVSTETPFPAGSLVGMEREWEWDETTICPSLNVLSGKLCVQLVCHYIDTQAGHIVSFLGPSESWYQEGNIGGQRPLSYICFPHAGPSIARQKNPNVLFEFNCVKWMFATFQSACPLYNIFIYKNMQQQETWVP